MVSRSPHAKKSGDQWAFPDQICVTRTCVNSNYFSSSTPSIFCVWIHLEENVMTAFSFPQSPVSKKIYHSLVFHSRCSPPLGCFGGSFSTATQLSSDPLSFFARRFCLDFCVLLKSNLQSIPPTEGVEIHLKHIRPNCQAHLNVQSNTVWLIFWLASQHILPFFCVMVNLPVNDGFFNAKYVDFLSLQLSQIFIFFSLMGESLLEDSRRHSPAQLSPPPSLIFFMRVYWPLFEYNRWCKSQVCNPPPKKKFADA